MVNEFRKKKKTQLDKLIAFYFLLFTDHTTNTVDGRYMFLETSKGSNGDRARQISPLYRKSSRTCMFTFW